MGSSCLFDKFDLRSILHEILIIGNLEVKFGDRANMDIKLIFPLLSLDTCTCNMMESWKERQTTIKNQGMK
jgi:hypothetical protein